MAYQSIPAGASRVIENVALSAVSARTITAWPVGAYKKITIGFVGASSISASSVTLQFNADSGLNYQYISSNNGSATITPGGDIVGNISSVPVAVFNGTSANDLSFLAEIDIAKLGFIRHGRSASTGMRIPVVLIGSSKFEDVFVWNDSASDVTFFTLGVVGGTITGQLTVTGYT